MRSLGQVLDEQKGFGHGFDFVRVFLACSVLGWHCYYLARGTLGTAPGSGLWIYNYSILPMFFGLSGFLVAGSAQRLSLGNFFLNRGLRIFPALIMEIALSALVLGVMFTDLPQEAYFTSPRFFRYFTNIVGLINYRLPGVFAGNPVEYTVNGSLWTVPFELLCYAVMGCLLAGQAVRDGRRLIAYAAGAVAVSIALQGLASLLPQQETLTKVMDFYLHDGKGPALLPCFLLGAAAYALRHQIPFDGRIAAACLGLLAAVGVLGSPVWWTYTPIVFLVAPVMIYLVCYAGLLRFPALPYFSRGDYSYGIYLYGFPIQQALVAWSGRFRNPWWLALASVILVSLFATLSWHGLEKPVLRLRKRFSFVARGGAASEAG